MKISLKEITAHRTNEHCYLIETIENKYLVIYGTRYVEIDNGDLYNIISSFLDDNDSPSWNFVRKRLKYDRDEDIKEGSKSKWLILDIKTGEKILDVSSLYIDGDKII